MWCVLNQRLVETGTCGVRHHYVADEERDLIPISLEQVSGLPAVGGGQDGVATPLERFLNHSAQRRVVFRHQQRLDSNWLGNSEKLRSGCLFLARISAALVDRELDAKGGALARLALDLYVAAVLPHDAVYRR